MATTEHTINDALAKILRETRHAWRDSHIVSSENTGMLKGSNKRPDILILEPNVSPVVIETEVQPASTVEIEAISRLGEKVRTTGKTILSSIAVRLPIRLREKFGTSLDDELLNAYDLEIALYTGTNSSEFVRFPKSGWITGNIATLSILSQSASIPPEIIEEAANQLVSGVSEAAGILEDIAHNHPGAIHKISEELRQEDGEQTRRMAATIIANAFVFHESLVGGPEDLNDVKTLEELRDLNGKISKTSVLSEWRKILKVNYWAIFDIARRILEVIPIPESASLMEIFAETAEKLLQNRLMRSHDLTGAVFQRLIADRKFLAAYYTTPASASLLVGLAISSKKTPNNANWENDRDVKNLRVADFACGTGTLLTTAYQRISQLHELKGGNSEANHPQMMASALVGCDVLPAAAHLTASMLSGAHPTIKYKKSSILTVAYGKHADGSIALGSLDLLNEQGTFEILAITAKAIGGTGESEKDTWLLLPHSSFDLVIMNPPFTRATGHEGKKVGVHNPMFAAFSASAEDQRLMAKATVKLTKGTSAHGNAGEASIFLVLSHFKLKTDGVMALIMPLSLMSGEAWENSRLLLSKNYSELILVSIAGAKDSEMSFSADTDMGECMIVGRKTKQNEKRATFVVLKERPKISLLGMNAAEQITKLISERNMRKIEDGPVGGTSLYFGDEVIGQVINAPLPESGGWNLARIADLSLAQTAYQLANEKSVWLPTMNKAQTFEIPITTVGEIGIIGPYHMDINGRTPKGEIRGPFNVRSLPPNTVPTYPILWSHTAENERTIQFEADSEGIQVIAKNVQEQQIIDEKINNILESASNCHFNQNFRFNSQSTGMQYTSRRTIGGRAWLSIQLDSSELEKVLVLWANTSLGLLLYWWHSNKQQSGRGSIGKTALQSLPVLDVTVLSSQQIDKACSLFEEFKQSVLLPKCALTFS
jgi:hypothetical protein